MRFSQKIYQNYSLEDWVMDPDFQSYCIGSDPKTLEEWNHFFRENPDTKPLADQAKDILVKLNQPSFALEKEEVNELWFAIQNQVKPQPLSVAKSWFISSHFGKATAAIFIFGLLGILTWIFFPSKSIEYVTGFGETIQLILPDSSEVTLNSNSKLVYSGNWQKANRREVHLTGEAFFKVRHLEDNRPFLVIPNNGLEIEVLGTSFNVYQRREETRIVLSEGKVELKFQRSKQDNIEMSPGDLISVSEEKISRRKVDAQIYTSWTQKVLTLNKTTLTEIIQVAEENFGLEVVVSPGISVDQTASGSVPLTDSDQFMRVISKVFNFQIDKKDFIYYIH